MKKTIFLFLLFPAICFGGIGLYGNPTPVIIHKGTNAPVLVKLFDADNSLLTAAEIAAITKIEVYYTPGLLSSPETTDSITYAAGFDKSTYAASGEIMLKIGLVGFTPGRDREAELIIYDATYTSGRVIGLLDMKVSSDVEAGADMVDALTGQSYKFKTISVAGQSSVVADSNTDTLTLVAGDNITLTTNAGSDSITIDAAESGTTEIADGVTITGAGTIADPFVAVGGGGTGGGEVDETLATNLSYSGTVSTITVGETVAFGDHLYRSPADGLYYRAQANAILTVPVTRMALESANVGEDCLTLCPGGVVRNDAWNFTDDGSIIEIWLSASIAGGMTESVDTSENCFGQVVGTPLASNILEFRPMLPIARF